MGDFWPNNILIKLTPDKNLSNIYVIDWELSITGPPGVDIGEFCGDLDIITQLNPAASQPAATILSHFISSYAYIANAKDDALARDSLAHWGAQLVTWAPRATEYEVSQPAVRELVKQGVQYLLDSQKEGPVVRPVVRGLLPESLRL
jgi:thiamine kinase-like enzyme